MPRFTIRITAGSEDGATVLSTEIAVEAKNSASAFEKTSAYGFGPPRHLPAGAVVTEVLMADYQAQQRVIQKQERRRARQRRALAATKEGSERVP